MGQSGWINGWMDDGLMQNTPLESRLTYGTGSLTLGPFVLESFPFYEQESERGDRGRNWRRRR